jgi:hypothetical protein
LGELALICGDQLVILIELQDRTATDADGDIPTLGATALDSTVETVSSLVRHFGQKEIGTRTPSGMFICGTKFLRSRRRSRHQRTKQSRILWPERNNPWDIVPQFTADEIISELENLRVELLDLGKDLKFALVKVFTNKIKNSTRMGSAF